MNSGLSGVVQLSGASAVLRIDPQKNTEVLNVGDVENLIREWQTKLEYMRKVEAALGAPHEHQLVEGKKP